MSLSFDRAERPEWVPADLDLERPSAARMYDYLLGGFHNFEIDRKVAEEAIQAFPGTVLAARINRSFLRRSVEYLASNGIAQFIDIGSGIPTVGHVHEIALQKNPDARVVYVDIDPIAVAHSESILQHNANAGIIMADARNPERILTHELTRRLIDFDKPAAVLFVAILHFLVDEEEAQAVIGAFIEGLPAGSYAVVAHPTLDDAPEDLRARYAAIGTKAHLSTKHRTRQEIEKLLRGLDLVEPGLVYAPLWRPETPKDLGLDQPEHSLSFVAVGRKQ